MYLKKLTVLFALLFVSIQAIKAQHNAKTGFLTYYNVSKALPKNWKITFNNQTRFPIYDGEFALKKPANIHHEISDFGVFVTKKIHSNHTVGGLALIRFEGIKKHYRYNLHYIYSHKVNKLKLNYRVVFDQTFNNKNAPIYRTRHRIFVLIPFKDGMGKNEFYFRISNEYFTIIQAKNFDFEVRVFPALGYFLNKKISFELGLDYRINEFVGKHGTSSNVFWINGGFSVSL